MKIPNEIDILGITYKIEEVYVVRKDESLYGEINYEKQTIRIDEELSEEKKAQVFLHEILHAIMECLGLNEWNQEENVIQSLAAALYYVLSSQAISF